MKSVEYKRYVDNRNFRMMGEEVGYEGIRALLLTANGYIITSVMKIGEYQQIMLDEKIIDYRLQPGILEKLYDMGLVKQTEDSGDIRQKYEISELGQAVLDNYNHRDFTTLANALYRNGFKIDRQQNLDFKKSRAKFKI